MTLWCGRCGHQFTTPIIASLCLPCAAAEERRNQQLAKERRARRPRGGRPTHLPPLEES